MFWRLELATVWRLTPVAKIACLAEIRAVFKLVSVFPRTSVTVHLLSKNFLLSKHSVNPFSNLIGASFLIQIIKKRYGFAFSISYSLLLVFPADVWVDIVYDILLSYEMGMAGLV